MSSSTETTNNNNSLPVGLPVVPDIEAAQDNASSGSDGTDRHEHARVNPRRQSIARASTFASELENRHERPDFPLGFSDLIAREKLLAFYNLLLWIVISTTIYCGFYFQDFQVLVLPVVIAAIAYVAYVSQSFANKDFDISRWKSEAEALKILTTARNVTPVLQQRIVCYHLTHHANAEVETITRREQQNIVFTDWYDNTPYTTVASNHSTQQSPHSTVSPDSPVDELKFSKHKKIMRLFIKSEYKPANEFTVNDFKHQKDEFINSYRTRDSNFRYSELYMLPDVPELIMVYKNTNSSNKVPFLLKRCVYIIAVLFGFAFPFKTMLSWLLIESKVWVNKKVLSSRSLNAGLEEEVPEAVENVNTEVTTHNAERNIVSTEVSI